MGRIYTKEWGLIEREVDIVCDSCGNSCKKDFEIKEYMSLSACWGYGSKRDGEIWEAYLCEDCVESKLGFVTFKKTDLR